MLDMKHGVWSSIVWTIFGLMSANNMNVQSNPTTTAISNQTQYAEFYSNYPIAESGDQHMKNYRFLYYIQHAPSMVYILHREERQGDFVSGQYGLLESNGNVRNVHYVVDGPRGFHSIVRTRTAHSRTHFHMQQHLPTTTTTTAKAVRTRLETARASSKTAGFARLPAMQPLQPIQHQAPVAFI